MTYPLTALTTPQYNALRGNGSPRTFKSSQFLCILSNTVLLAARVNQSVFTASFAQLTFDNVTEGAYTNVSKDVYVLISHTSDKRAAYFEARARADNSGVVATSTILNIDETSETIADNDYIWVIRDVRPFHQLGRVSGGTYYKDFTRTFFQLRPIISGLASAYAGIVSGSPAGFTVSFSAIGTAATSGATISSYAYTLPASGATVVAGATNTANVTVRFDASATEYWVTLVVIDSAGRAQIRYIPVWAVPADLSTTVVRGFTGAHIEGALDSGWTATVDAFAGVSDVLDGTLCCIFDVEYYQEAQYTLFSTVKFVGRFRKESNETTADEVYSTKRKVSFEIEGTAAQLARISSPEITARDAASPTVWDEIKTLTVWRAITYLLEHSTFHESFSLSFDSTSNVYRAYQLEVASGSQFESVKDLASSIDAIFEFAPTGETRIVRHAPYLTIAERNALVTVADFTASDWINFTLEREYFETVGLVEASGGTYSPTGGGISGTAVQACLSIAPGVAQGNGSGTTQLSKQILLSDVSRATAQAEINIRAGNHFAASNPTPTLNVDMRGAYNWLIPSANQWYTWAISTGDNRRGIAYTSADRWLLKSVSIDHDNVRGNKTVSAQFELETSAVKAGVVGQTVVIPPQNNTPPVVPQIPPLTPYPNLPPPPDIYLPPDPDSGDLPPITLPDPFGIPLDGNAVAIFSANHIWVTKTFITTPSWIEITPDDMVGTVRDIARIGNGLYAVTSDGTDSFFYYRAAAFGGTAWDTVTTLLDSVYTQIITTSTEGGVYLKGSIVIPGGCADDWDIAFGTEISRTSNSITASSSFGSGSNHIIFSYSGGSGGPSPAAALMRRVTSYASVAGATDMVLAGWFLAGGSYPGDEQVGIYGGQCIWWGDIVTGTGSFTCEIILNDDSGCGTCGSDSIVTTYSDDFGATFATPEPIAAGGEGADSIKIGTVLLAAGDTQVRIATPNGDPYADYGSALPTGFVPISLVVPRKTFAGGSNVATATPNYLIASSAVDGASNTLYKVTAIGVTFTDITPSVSGDTGLGLGVHCVWIPWWSSSIIFAVMMFGSSPRLIKSTNAGTSWSNLGILDDDATMVIGRSGDRTMKQLYLTNGTPAYSPNSGVSIISKNYPMDSATEPVLGIQVWG